MRVLIVADDPLARAGIAALVADQPLVTVSGLTPSDGELRAAVTAYAPDAVIWDLGWDVAARIEALSRFCDENDLPVLALLANPNAANEVRAAGARALLSRATGGAQLASATSAIGQGLLVFDPDLLPPSPTGATGGVPSTEPGPGDLLRVEPLSPRELDVLRSLAEGASNKQIARTLGISEHTVKFHINAILGKLGAQSRTEAVVRATRAGLILL
jgi:DNA-binding NarL/FixJ family response regulator